MVYVNPAGFPTEGLPNIGWQVFVTLMVMVIVAGFFVFVRVAARISVGQLGSDDYAIMVALGFFIVQTTLWALSVRAGYGADYLKLAHWQQVLFNKWWFLGSIFWLCTLATYKISVLLLLNRIFVQRPFKIACWSVTVVTCCWAVGNILGWIFQCTPVPIMWGGLPEGATFKCFNQNGLWISILAWDVTTDFAILVLPQPMVWKLSLKTRERFMLTLMFLLGAVVLIFSVLSCGAVAANLEKAGRDKNQYSLKLANLFQVLESGMGVIGACLPLMRQPLKKVWPRLVSSLKRQQDYYDDDFTEQYVMQNVSNGQPSSQQKARNSISVTAFKSNPRQSDEMRIINNTAETRDASGRHDISGYDTGDYPSRMKSGSGIRKDIGYAIDRR